MDVERSLDELKAEINKEQADKLEYYKSVYDEKVARIKREYSEKIDVIEANYVGVENSEALKNKAAELKTVNKKYYRKLDTAKAEYDKNVKALYEKLDEKLNALQNADKEPVNEQNSFTMIEENDNDIEKKTRLEDVMKPRINLEESFHKEYYYIPNGMNVFYYAYGKRVPKKLYEQLYEDAKRDIERK